MADICFWEDALPEWTYNMEAGEGDWGCSFPDANGENQSPIDINSRTAEYDESLNDASLTLTYNLCRETVIANNGHTVIYHMKYKPGDGGYGNEQAPKSALRGGPLRHNHEYVLDNFRFHWGRQDDRGSEHTVNFKAFPMELHLLHYNSTLYESVEDAIGKPEGVAIIALFIMNGREHHGIKVLIEQLSDLHYKDSQKTVTSVFNPNCLLPDPMLRDFWTYQGSLTSPPCSENVTWIIFRYPLTFSHAQIEEFRRLRMYPKGENPDVSDSEDGALVDNFRPTQQINDRIVRASFQ